MIEQESRNSMPYRPYTLNSFMQHTRLNKQFLKNRTDVDPHQLLDIIVKGCPAHILYLSLTYHLKFPRYIVNKLQQLKASAIHKATDLRYLIVLIENDSLTADQQFTEIQKLALSSGYSLMPAWSCEDVRSLLQDLRTTYQMPKRTENSNNNGYDSTQKQ